MFLLPCFQTYAHMVLEITRHHVGLEPKVKSIICKEEKILELLHYCR